MQLFTANYCELLHSFLPGCDFTLSRLAGARSLVLCPSHLANEMRRSPSQTPTSNRMAACTAITLTGASISVGSSHSGKPRCIFHFTGEGEGRRNQLLRERGKGGRESPSKQNPFTSLFSPPLRFHTHSHRSSERGSPRRRTHHPPVAPFPSNNGSAAPQAVGNPASNSEPQAPLSLWRTTHGSRFQ